MANLLNNPNFELDFTDWTQGPNTSISTIDPQGGIKCVEKSVDAIIGTSDIVSQPISTFLNVGTNYTLRVWVKTVAPPSPVDNWFLIMGTDQNNISIDINNNFGVWRRLVHSFTATSISQTVIFRSLVIKVFPEPIQMFLDTTQFAPTSLICFAGDTLIKTMRGMVPVQDLQEGIDEIVSLEREGQPSAGGESQILKKLVVTGPTTKLVKIKAGLISETVPERDTVLTRGHKLIVGAQEIKSIDLPGRIILHKENILVYAPIVEKRMAGLANGMPVVIDGEEQFENILGRD